jgi:general secretion pathway protein I
MTKIFFKKTDGFTLLEILVAISILGIAITVVIQLFSANIRSISASEDYVLASLKAEAAIKEITGSDDISEKAWSETTPDGYRVDGSIIEVHKDRTEKLPVSIFLIETTIKWTKAAKEKSIKLSTMKTVPKKV